MKFILNKDVLTIEKDENEKINSGSVKYYEAEVEHDETWNNLTIEARIAERENSHVEPVGIGRSVIDNKIYLDKEMHGRYCIGFVGYTIENEEKVYQISTNLMPFSIRHGAGEIETENEPIPTPTEWEIYIAQIQEMLDNFSGVPKGGTTGQVLAKKSNADGDVEWKTIQGGGGTGDHSELDNLDYEHSGHTGFQPAGNYVEDNNYVHTDNNYTNTEKNKLANLQNYDDTEIKQDITDLETNKADRTDIPDVSSFITASVNNLLNYYLKSETYTKTEVNNLIGQISTLQIQVVNELPQTGDSKYYYLVPSSNPKTKNVKDEYIWTNNAWEQIGSTQVDLTGYATESWVNTQISRFLTQSQIEALITNALTGYAKTEDIPTELSDLNDDSTHRTVTDTEKATWNNKSDFSGDYNDLSNKPTIPTVQTNVSAFTNDAGYLTSHQDISGKEDKINKVTSISSSSTDTQYPSAKAVYDLFNSITDGDEVLY